jgi:hypothetical protein
VGRWPADVTRLKERYFSSDDQLLTLRLAALATGEICGPRLAYGPELGQVARDLDIGVSVDAVFGAGSSAAILRWARDGLLKPRLTLVHSTGLSPDAWRAMGDAGVIVALAPTADAQIGLESAVPAIDESLSVGIRPGLSIDVEVALVSEMVTQMRTLLAIQRMRAVNAVYGTDETPQRITTRDVLDFATLQGARTNGLDDITGSLTPGTQEDLLLVHAEDINNMPLNDAVRRSCSAPKHATSTPSSSRVSPQMGRSTARARPRPPARRGARVAGRDPGARGAPRGRRRLRVSPGTWADPASCRE